MEMKWASALATTDRFDRAIGEVGDQVEAALEGSAPHLLMAFVSPHHRTLWDTVPGLLRDRFPKAVLLGCSGGAIIGAGREVEDGPALALLAASLPATEIVPVRVSLTDVPSPENAEGFWRDRLGAAADEPSTLLLLPDPFSFEAEQLVDGIDRALPQTTTIGGLASGARQAGRNMLFLEDGGYEDGAVAVALRGGHRLDTLVAQGCRPVGHPLFVTGCERHRITELDGQPCSAVLHALIESLSPHEQELLRYSLFVGVVMEPDRTEYGPGDFLIRNLVGIDQDTGALVVAATLEKGQVIQFHLRDQDTSAEDLAAHLAVHRAQATAPPAGLAMFTCLGRGRHLYGVPDHDIGQIRAALGDVPIGGFFCNGEIGPVRGRTSIHGYTTALAIFCDDDSGGPADG